MQVRKNVNRYQNKLIPNESCAHFVDFLKTKLHGQIFQITYCHLFTNRHHFHVLPITAFTLFYHGYSFEEVKIFHIGLLMKQMFRDVSNILDIVRAFDLAVPVGICMPKQLPFLPFLERPF